MHLKMNSRVADHCFCHALSDPKNPAFQEQCEDDHVHDDNSLTCNSCERIKNVFMDIKELHINTEYLNNAEGNAESNEDNYDITESIREIEKWRAHIVRGVWCDMAKQKVLDHLQENEVFITLDWAM